MAQSVFGAGFLWGTPSGSNQTPRLFAAMQDVSVDFSFDMKQLHGQHSFALEQARGKGKIDIKASLGRIDPLLFNDLFFGMTAVAGETLGGVLETAPIPGTPFTITVTNSATWARDLGVFDTSTGLFMTRVASAPTTGQYSVAAGEYLFALADVGHVVKISYTYTSASTGKSVAGTNPVMGTGPTFRMDLVNSFKSKTLTMSFPAVQSSKLSFPMKLDDFALPSLDFSAQDDGTGSVFNYSMTG